MFTQQYVQLALFRLMCQQENDDDDDDDDAACQLPT